MKVLYKNANLFLEGKGFVRGGFLVERGRFSAVFEGSTPWDGIDLGGAYVIPGLVDAHIHGAAGADFSDGDKKGLARMGRYLALRGVTSFAPASMTLPYETLAKAFHTAARLAANRPDGCARIAGIHMEGPFFSEKKKGAQNGAFLKLPDFDAFQRLYHGCGGLIRIVDVAPELPGAVLFAEKAAALCTVSAAHTDADYDTVRCFFAAGARHLTHLYNAMPGIHHRAPGPIGAAAEREDVTAELICDGYHVHPSGVRMAFRLFPGRICLVSDALRCCGLQEGDYELGGQMVRLKNGVAQLGDGTLAGAASDLYDDMRNAIAFGIPVEEAIQAATIIPAQRLGCGGEIGSIATGKYADFIVCDERLERKQVFLGGQALSVS